ncbi:MAG: response regulator [Gemmatimonadaceae bacterium]|nr:response regulator [Gemmatimonadaceae bacterium]
MTNTRHEPRSLTDALLEHSIELVNILAEDGSIRWISPSLKSLLGYETTELIGRRPMEFVHPDDAEVMLKTFHAIQAQPGVSVPMCVRLRHKGGSWRWMEGCGQNLLHDPVVRGITTNSHDVSDRVAMIGNLNESQRMESVGRLAGGVAHEFNNLLTVISYYSESLLESAKAEMRTELEEIKKASDRAITVTRQLLAFSRQQVLRPATINVNIVVNQATSLLRKALREDVALVCALDAAVGSVKVDPAQLTNVLVTLVTNAANAIGDGGTITITTASVDLGVSFTQDIGGMLPGLYTSLSVSDTGASMDPETIAKVFEPFYSAPGRGKQGGIGLSAIYGIVRQSGGYIHASSPGKSGVTFNIHFPAITKARTRKLSSPRSADIPKGSEGALVLVAEDEDGVRKVMRHILEKAGFRVVVHENGKSALDYLERMQGRIDFLLTDTVMPELGGEALVKEVRRRWPQIPVAFMSGHSDEAVKRDGRMTRGTWFLRKPFPAAELVKCIRDALRVQGS